MGNGARALINCQSTSLAALAYVGIFPAFSATSSTTAASPRSAQQASLFIPLMPVFGTFLSALFLAKSALVPLPRHRTDFHRHLADNEKMMALRDWFGGRRPPRCSRRPMATHPGRPAFLDLLAVDEKKAENAGRAIPGREGIQYRRRSRTERRDLRRDRRPGLRTSSNSVSRPIATGSASSSTRTNSSFGAVSRTRTASCMNTTTCCPAKPGKAGR